MADEETLKYPFWICMKGRSKSGGKLFGIATTQKEAFAWRNGGSANWTEEVNNADDVAVYAEGITGFQEDED